MRALRQFHCLDCGEDYEEFASYDESHEYPTVECPKCQSKHKEVILGMPSVTFTNPIGTDRWMSDSQGHDYRHKWNMDRPGGVRDQRKHAEEHSHMGKDVYVNHDDISSGNNFDPSKW